jgi:uncharacterized protein
MIDRFLFEPLMQALGEVPAVCLLGPRQVGKTTLAHMLGQAHDAIYLDLESDRDLAKLTDAEAYLELHRDRLVILDEVQRAAGLFPVLRGLIDRGRREGRTSGRFLLLGSASPDLLRQSGESLAGRIRYFELTPCTIFEVPSPSHDVSVDRLWSRGGYPESLLAHDDARSLRWRQDFIRTYLERDLPHFGARIPAETLRRFWTMLAHRQGAPLNAAELARSIGMDQRTVNRYLDLLVDLYLVRRLEPWHANVGKRLVKSPRIYVRDSGLVHALLGIPDLDTLLSHPVLGASWEGFAIEQIAAAAPDGAQLGFYRSTGGAEIDLVLVLPGHRPTAIEIKRSSAPRVERGFHEACADLEAVERHVVYPGSERFPLGDGIEAIPLRDLTRGLLR